MTQKGLLLVNLGTPNSAMPSDVFRYLNEFLTDGRVIDEPWLKRQVLVRGVIVPSRYKISAKTYQAIWTEEGSPLMFNSVNLKNKVAAKLDGWQVELAMRYQAPNLEAALERLKRVDELVVLPLFPQYASATTGSIHEKVMRIVSKWETIPSLKFIRDFYNHPELIEGFAHAASNHNLEEYDEILFSFHGLPVRQLIKSSEYAYCKGSECCKNVCRQNKGCYGAQCYETARLIAEKMGLKKYRVSFQSRLGKQPWLEPYTLEVLNDMRASGAKKVLVFCPAFVADCLETLYEIGIEYAAEFKHKGGEKVDLVPALNDSDYLVRTILSLI